MVLHTMYVQYDATSTLLMATYCSGARPTVKYPTSIRLIVLFIKRQKQGTIWEGIKKLVQITFDSPSLALIKISENLRHLG